MPLIATGELGVPEEGRRAIGFWMIIEGASPIRVFVTFEALWQIDLSYVHDVPSAIAIFEENRKLIEAVASTKWDANDIEDCQYDGRPILIVHSEDLPRNSNRDTDEERPQRWKS